MRLVQAGPSTLTQGEAASTEKRQEMKLLKQVLDKSVIQALTGILRRSFRSSLELAPSDDTTPLGINLGATLDHNIFPAGHSRGTVQLNPP